MDTTAAQPEAPSRRRAWAFAGTAVAVLLLLALTPPYLNVNRLQRRIAASMSASLGRPVHLDHVTLHVLPLPGFTLENLVVSEDPEFGDEPVIRANTVEITLRLSSLWRRQVELSSIRFVEPSLNLVRNPAGRWNLQSLLNHAAQASNSPPAAGGPLTRHASPALERGGTAPRFPYIEATDARVNVKLGAEKKPFSLTEADFALWLPDTAGWRVRLTGKPARTDENISDPGVLKLEGSLRRADTMAAVPVDLTASWEGAPLGEASRLLSGQDANFRGKLTVNATLNGTLGAAKLVLRTHVEELRRADFVPALTLDLLADCSGTADVTTAVVTAPACKLSSATHKSLLVNAVADSVDLSRLLQPGTLTGLRVGSASLPESWVLDAARLFSQRIPAGVSGTGNLSGSFILMAGDHGAPAFWQGSMQGELPLLPTPHVPAQRTQLLVAGTEFGVVLAPVNLIPPGDVPPVGNVPSLTLSGLVDRGGYQLHLVGNAPAAQLNRLRSVMPPLTDGLDAALPELTEASPGEKPIRVDVTCTRRWRAAQACTQSSAPEPPRRKRKSR